MTLFFFALSLSPTYSFQFLSVFRIPQRVILAGMCFLAIAIAYVMRACLAIAITEMANKIPDAKNVSVCPADTSTNLSLESAVNLQIISKPIKINQYYLQ